ncbi:oxidoreductase domain containing protein, partial [Metarhizium majus ARSEF 297]
MGYASEEEIQAGEPRVVKYTYNDVAIPEDFLAGPPPEPVKMEHVDFASSNNVLSEAECQQFMELAKEAVPDWSPALINVGGGLESHIPPKYRSGSRKVWDHQGMVDSIFSRCLEAPGFKEVLARPPKLDETSDHAAVNPEH